MWVDATPPMAVVVGHVQTRNITRYTSSNWQWQPSLILTFWPKRLDPGNMYRFQEESVSLFLVSSFTPRCSHSSCISTCSFSCLSSSFLRSRPSFLHSSVHKLLSFWPSKRRVVPPSLNAFCVFSFIPTSSSPHFSIIVHSPLSTLWRGRLFSSCFFFRFLLLFHPPWIDILLVTQPFSFFRFVQFIFVFLTLSQFFT